MFESNDEGAIRADAKLCFESFFKLLMGAPCSVRFYTNGSVAFVVSTENAKVWEQAGEKFFGDMDPEKVKLLMSGTVQAIQTSSGGLMKFGYQWQKFMEARQALMLPHPQGERAAIGMAFSSCLLGLRDLRREGLESDVVHRLNELEPLLNAGVDQCLGDKLTKLSELICELADYFHREMWLSTRPN